MSWSRTFQAVAWSFFGVRKRDEHDKAALEPKQVIVAGIVAAVVFVGVLVLVVNWVIDSGVAAAN